MGNDNRVDNGSEKTAQQENRIIAKYFRSGDDGTVVFYSEEGIDESSIYGELVSCHDITDACFGLSGMTGLWHSHLDESKYLDLKNQRISKIVIAQNIQPKYASNLFSAFEWATCIEGLERLDASQCVNMHEMFAGCSSLIALDLSHFDTSNVTNMSSMFDDCIRLESLDVSSFDTSNVTDMSRMFYQDFGLEALDLSGFDTKNVRDMNRMFFYLLSATHIDVSGFDTGNAQTMEGMFAACISLKSLDISHFVIKGDTNITGMLKESSLDEDNAAYYHPDGWKLPEGLDLHMAFTEEEDQRNSTAESK